MSWRIFVAVFVACACARQVPYVREPQPCQDQVMDFVWRAYGRTDRQPDVWWVPRAAQNCGEPRPDGARGFRTNSGGCAKGTSWSGGLELVWLGADETWAVLAHEAAHVIDARDGRPPDPDHQGPAFRPGGLVAQVSAALAEADLCAGPRPSALVRR